MNGLKSGFMSSEFWIAAIPNIANALVVLGIVNPASIDDFVKALIAVVGGVLGIVYLVGRSWLKAKLNPTISPVSPSK